MLPTLRRLAALIALALALSLTACGGGQSAAPTAAPTAAATRTPRPTREPAPTEKPTEKPTEEPTEEVVLNDDELQMVDIGDLTSYVHKSGVFEIEIPENWDLQDTSTDNELILIWTDPTRNGAVIVDIFEDETVYTNEQLISTLETYLENSFGSQPDFYFEEPTPQSDGSILIVWTYTATADNDVEATLLGNTFIQQNGNKITLLSTLVPQAQFDELVDQTNEIINTYIVTPEASIS